MGMPIEKMGAVSRRYVIGYIFIAGLCSIDDDREPTLEFDHFTLPILLNQSSRYLPTRTLTGGIYRCICRSVK